MSDPFVDPLNRSVCIPDDQVAGVLIGGKISKPTRDGLRRRGLWPPNFYIGRRSYVLTDDIRKFIEQRKAAAPADRAAVTVTCEKAINARHGRTARKHPRPEVAA
jgi:hypothetical protein